MPNSRTSPPRHTHAAPIGSAPPTRAPEGRDRGSSNPDDATPPAVGATLRALVGTLESLGDAVIVTALDGEIAIWSAAATALLGWQEGDALGMSLVELLDPAPADVGVTRPPGFLDGAAWHGPATVAHRSRGKFVVHLSLAPVVLDTSVEPPVPGLLLRIRPWPDRARPQRGDALDAALLERALEHVNDLVLITTGSAHDAASARIVYVNQSFERVTGYSRDEVLGRAPSMLRGPDSDREASARIDDAVRDRTRIREELLHYTRQGEPLWLDIDVIPVQSPVGNYLQWVAVERDVTSQKGQEVALRAREERLRLAMNAVWDGLWDWHVPTGYCYYAPRWYAMLGFPEHALPPHIDTFLDLLHPQDLPRCEQALKDHFDGRTDTYALEVRLRTVDNQWRWVLTRGTVVERDQHDRPVRMVGTHTDIALRKQAELALRTSEDRFRTLTMASPLGIFLTDADGNCTFATPRMHDLWGAPADSLLGRGFLDAAHPDDRQRVAQAWQRAVREGGELSIEYRVVRPDGSTRWVCERTAAHKDGNNVTGFVGTVEDISAAKAAAEDRRRLETQMQHAQKLESLGVLAGGIAHDFNNLLVGILGNASLAREDLEPGTATEELLTDIETAARRAAELTMQLLAYAGKGRFNVQPLDLSKAVREMSTLLQSAISKRATLSLGLADDLPLIDADNTQVRQVIMNLLTNASDALQDQNGGIVLRTGMMHADAAYLAACLAADGVEPGAFVFVEVADTGVGMDADTLPRIFEPFYTTKFTGRGLGLAATLGIVRGHRGAVHVHSTPGDGTVFRVLFPTVDKQIPSSRTPRSVIGIARTGTILVVDDEDTVREVARRMLVRSGYRVIEAADGAEALRLFEEHQAVITAIVLDVTMPRMSGTEVVAELRRRGNTVPIVLASGYSAQSLAAPASGDTRPVFVQKPFVTRELLDGIDAALERDANRPR
ncbi:MAG: PAS domain S-box protein [Gemmatimonadaceae bacterium]|nr:PAS domain S-box protein [Gemmatimonadaceae bacterium]